MKDICLLTIYLANYGAVLQTYALQVYLRNLPKVSNVYIANFYSTACYDIFRNTKGSNFIKTFFKRILLSFKYFQFKRKNIREIEFMSQNCKYTKRYESFIQFTENLPNVDIFLTGSDQVFNPNSAYFDYFFQNFHKRGKLKVAYASSLGLESFPDPFGNFAKMMLEDFDFLSCREETAAKYISKLTGKTVEYVVDPTLLLNESEWTEVATCPNIKGRYILVYDLNGGQELINIAQKVSDFIGCKIVCLKAKFGVHYKNIYKHIYDAGPREFVGLFKGAEYVVTDSFHGTMFSLIFGKPFNVYIAVERTSSRIRSILSCLEMEDYIIDSKNVFRICDVSRKNYTVKLNELILNSKKYIEEFISK